MSRLKKLPDTEFEVMKVVWSNKPPITTSIIMEQYGIEKGWKAPTAISLLMRLVERGYLSTVKKGKERVYSPLITREEYLQFETGNFFKQYHGNSLNSLVTTLCDGQNFEKKDIHELEELLERLKEQKDAY